MGWRTPFGLLLVLGCTLANVGCGSGSDVSPVSPETRQCAVHHGHAMILACSNLRSDNTRVRKNGLHILAGLYGLEAYTMLKLQWYAETNPDNQRFILQALTDSGEAAQGYFAGYEDEMLQWCKQTNAEEMRRRASDIQRILKSPGGEPEGSASPIQPDIQEGEAEGRTHYMFIACEYLRSDDPDTRRAGIKGLATIGGLTAYMMLKLQWYAEMDPENQRFILQALADSGEAAQGYFAGYEDEMLKWCQRTDSEEMKRRAADVERILKVRQASTEK